MLLIEILQFLTQIPKGDKFYGSPPILESNTTTIAGSDLTRANVYATADVEEVSEVGSA